MVIRKDKKNRKYFGTRRWGAGNIKNARGAGDRGGVGKAGLRKHKFTWVTAKHPELIRSKGFSNWNTKKMKVVTLNDISKMAAVEKKESIELRNIKVLSNGELTSKIKISAAGFSKKAIDKIKNAGGEAVIIEK
ncbi:MAG: uL15 family ribosomal protein [Candidatus Marsarchaeota archaeon]|nr:uL15 family ribosomal protein [Candidatus Marsarchaeota archaeon]